LSREPFQGLKAILDNLSPVRENLCAAIFSVKTYEELLASLGYRVVLASDALCSSSDETHDALMTLYRERFSQQIETVETATILAAWPS